MYMSSTQSIIINQLGKHPQSIYPNRMFLVEIKWLYNTNLTVMIQYFSKSSELGPLKQLPILKQSLKIVRISYPHNTIQKINPAVSKAQNTQQIDLSYNKISTIEPILQLRKLRVLYLSNNHIATVPKGILKLKKLEIIDLSHNFLGFVSSIAPLFQLYKLRKAELEIMLEGNKVFHEHQSEINDKMAQIRQQVKKLKQKIETKQQLKQLQISKSIQLHRRTNSPMLQQKPASQLITHGSKQIGSLSQAKQDIQNSLNSLNQLGRKFQVILASEFKGWSENLNSIFRKEADSVKSLVQTYRGIIKGLTIQFVNPSEATAKIEIGFIQASEIQELIKDQHSTMVEALSQNNQVPMNSYKIWVQLYRELRVLAERIRWEAWSVIQCEIRNQEIEALKLISPSKPEKSSLEKEDQLDGLLFSKNKQLNTQEKIDCNECFIKNEQLRQLRQIVELLNHENTELKERMESLEKDNQRMSKDDAILGKMLIKRQEEIIQSINGKIDASVYQKVLLEQAKGIQDLIKCDRHLLKKQKQILQNTQKLADLCQTATAIAKDKATGQCKEGVSQFYLQDHSANSGNVRLPYFNKNTEYSSLNQQKSKKVTQNSATSTQKKRKFSFENAQKRDRNKSNNSISRSNLISRKTTQKQSQQSPTKYVNKNVTHSNQANLDPKIGEKNVVISDFAITETGKQNKCQKDGSNSRQALAELVARKTNQNHKYFNLKNIKNNQSSCTKDNKQREGKDIDDKIEVQNYQTYVPMDYHSVNLIDEQPYENYMRFHLRNSIIETLQKKGKRYSLSKNGTKLLSKEKDSKQILIQESKKSSARNSDRQLKSTQRISINLKDKIPQSNTKSYVEILGKLRH